LRGIVNNLGRQVIITTHSPLILNDVKPEEIIFLWKDDIGAIHSKKMFANTDMRESLDFLMPGEIWFNYGKDEIISRLSAHTKETTKA
jgi:predicted ATPase